MKHTAQVASGKLTGLVASPEWKEALEACATQLDGPQIERCQLRGVDLILKRGRLRGKAARRHGLRLAFGSPAPRLSEFANLTWLRARLFSAPKPLFAGVVTQFGVPHFQFLATEYVPESRTLREFLEQDKERDEVLANLAREVARMHSLGFVHRDLYPRNLLVRGTKVTFLDAWRGGPGFGWRGPENDLACLMLHGARWLECAEQSRFFADYYAERIVQDREIADRLRFASAIERCRTRLRNRLVKRPHERRGLELPSADWRVPVTT